MWAGDVCGLEDAERAEAIRRAVELSGVHGARVLVPDAHVSLRVRPCCDVMVAHLRVWQHFSIDHPVYGRVLDGRAHLVRRSYVAVVGT